MAIDAKMVAELRKTTGAGMMDAKNALVEAEGDLAKATEILRKTGSIKAAKKSERATGEGRVHAYIHSNNKLGAMVEILCETDFVARNEDFQAFAQDIAMHITATDPQCVRPEDVDADFVAKEKEIWIEQLKSEGKPEEIMEKIMEGKEQKLRAESALLSQPFVKDQDKTVEDLMNELVAKIGEKIEIGEFARFSF